MLITVLFEKFCLDWHVTETIQYELDNTFKISDSQSEQVHEYPSNGNFRRGWIMIKVMND